MTLINLVYFVLAVIGLGFLVFIHELGHYLVARRQGMRVEAFAIGFGKPIFTWIRDGVKWHICMLPFGGYVKIAGMQKEGNKEPSEISDGFFGKTPLQRIKVAIAGPVVNIVFALLVFTVLWFSGGRNKQFTEFTHHIGWVDPKSALYENGIRPGDYITKYDGRDFKGFKDLLIAGIMGGETTRIEGSRIDYATGKRTPFDYTLKTYENPTLLGKDKLQTIGVLSPARYMIFAGPSLIACSPMEGSGILPQDRVLWVDGEVIFSAQQLSALINESTAFFTVQRGSEIFHTKVPRVPLSDLKMTLPERGEIDDWQHEAGLKGRLQDLTFIPYNLSPTLEVEGDIRFIDGADRARAFDLYRRNSDFKPLQEGDQILAVDGKAIQNPYQLLTSLQTRKVLTIVDRDPAHSKEVLWKNADAQFDQFSAKDLNAIVASIGRAKPVTEVGTLHLLKPITPKLLSDFSLNQTQKASISKELSQSKKEVESIEDPSKRNEALKDLEKSQKKVVLGLPLADREVRYNPTPIQQFSDVFKDTYRTLYSLVTGAANPKYVAGPVGIVQIVHQSWMLGAKEALFWMALISLNLGIMNLLPLPVLDGGHILISLIEMITGRSLKAKTMERLIVPFVVLLLGFFVFVTFNDISRLFSKFF